MIFSFDSTISEYQLGISDSRERFKIHKIQSFHKIIYNSEFKFNKVANFQHKIDFKHQKVFVVVNYKSKYGSNS